MLDLLEVVAKSRYQARSKARHADDMASFDDRRGDSARAERMAVVAQELRAKHGLKQPKEPPTPMKIRRSMVYRSMPWYAGGKKLFRLRHGLFRPGGKPLA
jgi:hypothetical protein